MTENEAIDALKQLVKENGAVLDASGVQVINLSPNAGVAAMVVQSKLPPELEALGEAFKKTLRAVAVSKDSIQLAMLLSVAQEAFCSVLFTTVVVNTGPQDRQLLLIDLHSHFSKVMLATMQKEIERYNKWKLGDPA